MGRKGTYYGEENGAQAYSRTVNEYGESGASTLRKRWFWLSVLFATLLAGTAAGALSIEEISHGAMPEFSGPEAAGIVAAAGVGAIVGYIVSQRRASLFRSNVEAGAQSYQFGYERTP